MEVQAQFISFLIDRLETKVGIVQEHLTDEETADVIDEIKLHLDELKTVTSTVFPGASQSPQTARTTRRKNTITAHVEG